MQSLKSQELLGWWPKNPAVSLFTTPCTLILAPQSQQLFLLIINFTVLKKTEVKTCLYCKFLVFSVFRDHPQRERFGYLAYVFFSLPRWRQPFWVILIYVYMAILLLFPLWALVLDGCVYVYNLKCIMLEFLEKLSTFSFFSPPTNAFFF